MAEKHMDDREKPIATHVGLGDNPRVRLPAFFLEKDFDETDHADLHVKHAPINAAVTDQLDNLAKAVRDLRIQVSAIQAQVDGKPNAVD